MKRTFHLVLLALPVALGASAFTSCKEGAGETRPVAPAVTSPGVSSPRPSAPEARATASSPDLGELARRRTAWMEQRSIQDENKMTPERVRRFEMSRLELTSLSQEAAAMALELGEDERSSLRKALAEFRDATLFRLEHPEAGGEPRGPKLEPYQNRQRKILGDARYGEFSRLEQQEREKLIAGRRAFRKSAAAPTASQPTE